MPVPRPLALVRPLALALALGGCAGSIGVEEEEALGDEYAAQLRAEVPLLDDPAAQATLDRIGRSLAAAADSTERDYDFHLVDSPEVNAFAIPGGHIFVNRGLVEHADNVAELAGVLGHEIAHVTERHGLEQVEKRQRANLLLTLVYTVLGREPGLLEQVAIEGGGAAVFARYGRDAEREADARAVAIVRAAGYDPDGIATFFEELLRQQERQPGALEQWFSTHPTSAERVRDTRALIAASGPAAPGAVRDTPEYQRFRARLVSGSAETPNR
ncbi:MAG TPA: M48 family metallopeptidase [Longimicrobium sp.]|nr:M48 family metallopeptidase [Longimicrobium sp.]